MNNINDGSHFIKSNIDATLANLINRAKGAQDAGCDLVALHLYLAAYFYSASNCQNPNEDAISGLKQAWTIACNSHEHTLCEYIYDVLEPHLSNDELDHCNEQLRSLTLDQLAEFGISRDSLREVLDDIPDAPFGSKVVHVGTIRVPAETDEAKDDIDSEKLIVDAQSFLAPQTKQSFSDDSDDKEANATKSGEGVQGKGVAQGDSIARGDGVAQGDGVARGNGVAQGDGVARDNGVLHSEDVPLGAVASESSQGHAKDAEKNAAAAPGVALGANGFVEVGEKMDTPGVSLGDGFGFRTTPKNKQRPEDVGADKGAGAGAGSGAGAGVGSGSGAGIAAGASTGSVASASANAGASPTTSAGAGKGATTSAATNAGAGKGATTSAATNAGAAAQSSPDFEEIMNNIGDMLKNLHEKTTQEPKAAPNPNLQKVGTKITKRINYANTPGYEDAKREMIAFGLGLHYDPAYKDLVAELDEKHGINSIFTNDTIMFTGESREDVNKFMEASANEPGLPVLRMSVEENMQGSTVLCLSVNALANSIIEKGAKGIIGPAVLCLEDIDLWMSAPEDFAGDGEMWRHSLAQGARQAIALIDQAVSDSSVYVMASISCYGDIDSFFADLLSPFSMVNIEMPTERDRQEIWESLRLAHPSLKKVSLSKLIKYSANLSRFDIYTATREALEAAYKDGLMNKEFVPVTEDYLFERLSTFQPIESVEYKNMEDDVAKHLRSELESAASVDDLLGLSSDASNKTSSGKGGSGLQNLSDNAANNKNTPNTPPDFSL